MSSKHFANWSSTCFLFIPSRRDQLFYFITFCRFCQVNILWTEVHSTFSVPVPQQPVQNSQPVHSTTLWPFCQVNFSWTTFPVSCRSPNPFHGSRYPQVSSTFALVRQLYYYIMRFCICQVNICKRISRKTMQIAQASVLPSYKTMLRQCTKLLYGYGKSLPMTQTQIRFFPQNHSVTLLFFCFLKKFTFARKKIVASWQRMWYNKCSLGVCFL